MKTVRRRDFLTAVASTGATPWFANQLWGAPKIVKTTYTYKSVGQLAIKLDLHRPDDQLVRPLAVWLHGGALIMGHREGISSQVLDEIAVSKLLPWNRNSASADCRGIEHD